MAQSLAVPFDHCVRFATVIFLISLLAIVVSVLPWRATNWVSQKPCNLPLLLPALLGSAGTAVTFLLLPPASLSSLECNG